HFSVGSLSHPLELSSPSWLLLGTPQALNPAYRDKMGYGYGNKALAKLNPVYGEQNLLKQGRLG
ncbi:MAG: hypothetical protein VX080_10275, partial [SAR324 cluster bacterium]|nr:hypothetical protein [SAR324 cluster bacterium]